MFFLQQNRIAQALVHRISLGIENKDDFHALVLSNTAQADEPSYVTRKFCEISNQYSMFEIETLAVSYGLTLEQLYSRLFVGRLEYQGVLVKVHSNIIIQDGIRAIRTSSNLIDRSLSPAPTDVELGVMLQGQAVHDLQQDVLQKYMNAKQNEYSIKEIVQTLQHQENLGIMYPLQTKNTSRRWTIFLMEVMIWGSGGGTGGVYNVTYEITSDEM